MRELLRELGALWRQKRVPQAELGDRLAACDLEPEYHQLISRFDDPKVDEVLINGTRSLVIVSGQRSACASSPFASQDRMLDWLQEFAWRHATRLDPLCPFAGGSLEEAGFRWHCLLPPLSQDGPLFSLRRHRFTKLGLSDFASSTPALQSALRNCFLERRPLLIAGPTSSGKTSLLAALLAELATDERVVIIESLPELPLCSDIWLRLVEKAANLEGIGAVGLERLMSEALRLRPDRLVIGEIRTAEARAFLEAAQTGHGGAVATIHAGSTTEARARLFQLADLSGRAPIGSRSPAVVLLKRGEPPLISSLEL